MFSGFPYKIRISLIGCWFLIAGCSADNDYLFTLLDNYQTNIHFRNILKEDENANVLNYTYFYNGGGVAIGDVNNDGLADVLFTGNMVANRLYINKGNLEFEDVTDKTTIASKQGWCTGATMVDINCDGLLDIYICRSADADPSRRKNLLYVNHGNLQFNEEADRYGVADDGYSTQAAFFDYDKDGDLDLMVINHSLKQYAGDVFQNPDLRKQTLPEYASKLYLNENGHFSDISKQAGITSNVLSFGLGLGVADINNDGWPDIYVSNDFNEPDYLFINNGNRTFTEKSAECLDASSFYSMGMDIADYNNDGMQDLVTLDMLPEDNYMQKMHSGAENFNKFHMLFNNGFGYQYSRNMLHKNNGDGTFSEIGQLAGISNTDWSWSALLTDFDNDGLKDLFVTNGYVKDNTNMDFIKFKIDRLQKERSKGGPLSNAELLDSMPSVAIPNYIFQNDSNGGFKNVIRQWGLNQNTISSGGAYADLDNDGDMDLIINNTNQEAFVYRNNSDKKKSHHYLKIKLAGNDKNRNGIGTKVKLYCDKNLYYQEQMPVRGFQSSVDEVLNFGVGNYTVIDSVVVIWNDDKKQRIDNVKTNQALTVQWKDAGEVYIYQSDTSGSQYFKRDAALNFVHKENIFSDFDVQPLLPNFLSRQGPCMARADVNGDGREDFFIGGAKGQASAIFIQQATGQFSKSAQPSLAKDSMSEDVAAEFFDADGDGDIDLYAGSGGYEFNENDSLLQDRLYFNDGKGNFSKKAQALPQMFISTGCVKATDLDGDGDKDLFVGGRVIPGRYPVSPESKILVNNGKGIFSDETERIAPAVKNIGMVTDAVWMDVNHDSKQDLIVVGEWMAVKVFVNDGGKLRDASGKFIKFPSSGWWNKILTADFDGDGDADLVIGNCGANTQFKVSSEKPMILYYEDFDSNGSIDPVLCYYLGDKSYPAASRDDLTDQLPMLRKKFLEYRSYAGATINDLFSQTLLQDASALKAEIMQTVFLENTKDGFVSRPLPEEVQWSPVYAMQAADFNGDEHLDLLCAGNNAWTRIKFGRYESNHGMLMSGDGYNHFTYIPQYKSGLNLRSDVRSMELIRSDSKQFLITSFNDNDAVIYRVKKD